MRTTPVPTKRKASDTQDPVIKRIRSTSKRKSDHAETPANKRLKFTFDDIATVTVGEGDAQQSFKVHKEVLCEGSKFFKAALTGKRWAESADRTVTLPNHCPQIFQAYVQLCYDGSLRPTEIAKAIAIARMGADNNAGSVASRNNEHFVLIFEMWTLGDYLGNSRIMNAVMDDLLSDAISHVTIVECAYVSSAGSLREVGPDSAWRRWLVDAVAAAVEEAHVDAICAMWPADFTRAVLKKFVALSGTLDTPAKPTMADRSRYIVDDLP